MLRFGVARLLTSSTAAPCSQLFRYIHSSQPVFGLEEFINLNPTEDQEKDPIVGSAWPKELLAKKSFDDLHKLWFVCLKEWNYLLSEEMRSDQTGTVLPAKDRIQKVRLSMDRIKEVLNERGESDPDTDRGRKLLMKLHAE